MEQRYLINGTDEKLSPFDRGFAYGDGVFRTLKVRYGKPLGWDFHYQKLVSDCQAIGIVAPEPELFLTDIYKLLEDEKTQTSCVMKLMVTRGLGERGYAFPAIASPVRVTLKTNLPLYREEWVEQGVVLYQCNTRLSHQPKLAGIKHLNRLENVLARNEWRDPRYFDGVMMDEASKVIECSSSNIFIRRNHQLLTPKLNLCGVAGVTRSLILSFGQALDMEILEADISWEDFIQADEVIVCNSLYGVFQVRQVNATNWPSQQLAQKCSALLNKVYAFV